MTSPATSTLAATGEQLITLLEVQRDLFKQMHSLAQRQHELIDGHEAQQLLAVLAKRGQHMKSLDETSRRLEPFRSRWDQLIAALDEATRQRIKAVLDETHELREAIAGIDEKDAGKLQDSQKQLQTELSRVNRGGQAVAAYGGRKLVSNAALYTDRKG